MGRMAKKSLLDRIGLGASKSANGSPAAGAAARPVVHTRDHRHNPRVNTYKDSTVFYLDGNRERCVIRDMSEGGCRIGYANSASLPDKVVIAVLGARYMCSVIWRTQFDAGLEYLYELDDDEDDGV